MFSLKTGSRVWIGIAGTAVLFAAGCLRSSGLQAGPTPLPVVADLSGITAEGRLEPIRFVNLSPSLTGLVSEVLVSEGEMVDAGQVLARLEDVQAETLESAQTQAALELGEAYEAVRIAQAELDDLGLPRIFSGQTAEQATRTWLAEFDAANKVFAPYRESSRKTLKPRTAFSGWVYPSLPHRVVYDTKEYDGVALVYKKRVDVALTNYTKALQWLQLDAKCTGAKARLADAQRRYDALHDPSMASASAGARAALATAEIRAPFAGTITTMNLKVGEAARAGANAATLADFSSWVIRTTDLTELDVVSIEAGMPVTALLDSMPDLSFSGSVLDVDLQFSDRQGDIVYPVRILLSEADPGMRWGMTAEVTFGT